MQPHPIAGGDVRQGTDGVNHPLREGGCGGVDEDSVRAQQGSDTGRVEHELRIIYNLTTLLITTAIVSLHGYLYELNVHKVASLVDCGMGTGASNELRGGDAVLVSEIVPVALDGEDDAFRTSAGSAATHLCAAM